MLYLTVNQEVPTSNSREPKMPKNTAIGGPMEDSGVVFQVGTKLLSSGGTGVRYPGATSIPARSHFLTVFSPVDAALTVSSFQCYNGGWPPYWTSLPTVKPQNCPISDPAWPSTTDDTYFPSNSLRFTVETCRNTWARRPIRPSVPFKGTSDMAMMCMLYRLAPNTEQGGGEIGKGRVILFAASSPNFG
ncbi:uncharacterized protein EI90DRAFT_3291167 [Cantharellus anzutake]|uniref:uncharacterized protein n=1 Tax=Cantharellus anzutake TaxID=1750568 RepID=UPI001903A785|nr:uncharacterized protein EI90DRAFT_3291167 [Cantharellus anzutake]KAF8327035.1 hypothetical protein EI90DRAFT_3291167 [Cantharellus anzutake]